MTSVSPIRIGDYLQDFTYVGVWSMKVNVRHVNNVSIRFSNIFDIQLTGIKGDTAAFTKSKIIVPRICCSLPIVDFEVSSYDRAAYKSTQNICIIMISNAIADPHVSGRDRGGFLTPLNMSLHSYMCYNMLKSYN